MTPAFDERSSRSRLVTRREAIAAIGGAAIASTVGVGGVSGTTAREAPLRVRIYPGPVPFHVWARYGFDGASQGWLPPFRDAAAAVETAVEAVLSYARERSRLVDTDLRVERGQQVRFPLSDAPPSSDAIVPSRRTVLDVFREQVRERDVDSGTTCHLLLSWSPFNYRLGYGGTHPELGQVGRFEDDGAYTVANLGATTVWDSRAVTRNMAIHETLHTVISSDVAEAVGDTRCDHNLGTAVRTDDGALRVSPMATAYAGPDEIGGGTRWHGRGCADRGQFHRHDGFEGVDRFEYTTELSEATLEAVTRYLERQLALE